MCGGGLPDGKWRHRHRSAKIVQRRTRSPAALSWQGANPSASIFPRLSFWTLEFRRSNPMETIAMTAAAAMPTLASSPPASPPMPTSLQIYISGQFYDKENAKISVYDHGLLYGDGVFEGMRSYSGKVFRLAQHLDRLWDSAKAIWLTIPISKAEMANAVNDTLAKNNIKDGYIRLIVTR